MAGTKIASELNAKVWQVEVAAGDVVAEGDTLIVLESMKMEIPVTAPRAGRVAEITVKEGDQVSEDQVVAVLED
jgi:acetyl-CoA carboxylase biotin carboxyl carrier protein